MKQPLNMNDILRILTEFSIDESKEQIVVYGRRKERPEKTMVIQKSARGVVVAIYDDAGYIITAQDGAAISAIASMWHRMLHPPENLLTEPPAIFVKHKKPDIYK